MRIATLTLALLPAVALAQIDPTPGPDAAPGARFKLAAAIADSPSAHPAAGWCVADAYRAVGGQAAASKVAERAEEAARAAEWGVEKQLAERPRTGFHFVDHDLVLPIREGVVCRTSSERVRRRTR